jgi:hypothetical protein
VYPLSIRSTSISSIGYSRSIRSSISYRPVLTSTVSSNMLGVSLINYVLLRIISVSLGILLLGTKDLVELPTVSFRFDSIRASLIICPRLRISSSDSLFSSPILTKRSP